MPLYEYTCPNGHTFEMRAGFDDEWVKCEKCVPLLAADPPTMAHRIPVYHDQSVHFKGPGFTKTTLPPPPPGPPVTKDLSADNAIEVQDEFVRKDYQHTENYREEAKAEAAKRRPEAIE